MFKNAKPYKARKLVHGFCVPSGKYGKEVLICPPCHREYGKFGVRAIEVSFDGRAKCAICSEVLK